MEEHVADADDQRLQHMLTDWSWDHRAVLDDVALAADQWLGGTADSCLLIDERLYLPKAWVSSPARCRKACIPEGERKYQSKSELALRTVRHQRALGVLHAWVGVDGGYGKEPAFLSDLVARGETFVVDVHKDQQISMERS